MGCEVCDLVAEDIDIPTPVVYFTLLETLRTLTVEKKLTIVRATCDFSAIIPGQPWPSDTLEHEFACSSCTQRYVLFVDSYHGWGNWKHA